MSQIGPGENVSDVVTGIADLFRHQSRPEIANLLERARAEFEETNYDNWNGGTTDWALRLHVPLSLFAEVEPRLSEIEKEIGAKLTYWDRQHPNDNFGEVTIVPITARSSGEQVIPSEVETRRVWTEQRFRLFLSHVSKHKVAVSELKNELMIRGVSAFVAHVDIEPSLEWRDEIELGLRSMHALAALMTDDFHSSNWTDQEIGWALGRGVPVFPVRLGSDPYGFAGKIQGISGTLAQPAALAMTIVDTLLRNQQSHSEMRRSIAAALAGSSSYVMTHALRKFIKKINDFTDTEKDLMRNACSQNPNVVGAHYAVPAIYAVTGEPAPLAKEDDDIPF